MEIDTGTGGTAKIAHALMGRHGGDHTGQDIAHAAAGHAGIARRVDVDVARLGRHDEGRRPFEDQVDLPVCRKGPSRSDEIRFDVIQGQSAEAGKFCQVGRHDESLSQGTDEFLFTGQEVQGVGVEDDGARRSG